MLSTCVDYSCKQAMLVTEWNQHANRSSRVSFAGKDASWVLTSSVIIFSMQTGFGVLESGCVNPKSEVNIMIKNALDVVFGGLSYWAFGFAFSFGNAPGTNPFIGVGCYFVDARGESMGEIFSVFLFQLSFATTATTIVSGAMAERTKLHAYLVFCMFNTVSFSVVAHWLWSETGFLHQLGAVDIAGCGPVHLVGGLTGFLATVVLGPRQGTFDERGAKPPLPSPLKALLGLFMLWWGWLRFCSGSVFVVSGNNEWLLAVRAAVNTMVASMGGGMASVITSIVFSHCCSGSSKYDIGTIINGVLGSLVSITAICTQCYAWEAFIVGVVGAILASGCDKLLWRLHVDDPVGVIPVHACCSIWGLLAVGLFVSPSDDGGQIGGLFQTGSLRLLGIQSLAVLSISAWTLVTAFILLKSLDVIIGLRLAQEDEAIGADLVEHGVSCYARHSHMLNLRRQMAQHLMQNGTSTPEDTADVELNAATHVDRYNEHSAVFKGKIMQLFMELGNSCERHNLSLSIADNDGHDLRLHLQCHESDPTSLHVQEEEAVIRTQF